MEQLMNAARVAAVVGALVALSLAVPALVAPASAAETRGEGVVVGAFRIHVHVGKQRVTVEPLEDERAADLPVTALHAAFLPAASAGETAAIEVGVENTGASSLVAPVRVVVTKLASPKTLAVDADDGTDAGSWSWSYAGVAVGGDDLLLAGETSSARRWTFTSPKANDFQVDVNVIAAVPLAPNEGAVIHGPGGTSVTVEPNSIPYEVLIDIAPAAPGDIVAPSGGLQPAGAVELVFEPLPFNTSFGPPSAPLQLSIPAPADAPAGSEFLVTQQVLADFVGEGEDGLREQLVAVDTASLQGDAIVTHPHLFPGIFFGGLFAFFFSEGGFVTGIVSDPAGPRPGAIVSNSTNTVIAVTDGGGSYTLPVSASFLPTVTGFDPFRGSSGSSFFDVPAAGATTTANITLVPLTAPPILRDGIRNSGFERGDLSSWTLTGAGQARQQLACTGATIQPTEGLWMADINTGGGSVGSVGSALLQRFTVPAGVTTLRFDYNFVSEEFPEFVGSPFDDSFRARITTQAGESTIAQVSVNNSGGFSLIGDCGFPGGDSTAGQTGWRQGSVNLSAFAGVGTPVQVDLLYESNDAGDNIYDTHVLIDNLRFATVWMDVKVIQGASNPANRIRNDLLQVNEILSQAGLNVRLRNQQTIADPGGLLDTDITWTTGPGCADGRVNGLLTAEETTLLGLSRSATATDVNVYYVRSGTGLGAIGYAISSDDFCVAVNNLTNSGLLIMDAAGVGNTLAHEFGHLLISPQTAGNALEHAAAAGNFLSTTPALGVVNRNQSANINRAGAPMLVP